MITRKQVRDSIEKSWTRDNRERIVDKVMEMLKGRNVRDIELELEITPNVIIHSVLFVATWLWLGAKFFNPGDWGGR